MEKYRIYNIGINDLPNQVHYWKLSDSGDGFNIKTYSIDNNDIIINIFFESTLSYRSINEGDRLELWDRFAPDNNSFIYVVEESEFLKNFHNQSKYIHDNEILKHYFIITTDDCFDVITECDPIISIEDQG